MDVDIGGSAVSWIALAFAGVSLVYGVALPWWRTREAHPEARFEILRRIGDGSREVTEHRLVLVNHGPAVMTEVGVRLVRQDGEEHQERGSWPPMPIPELHVGQAFHLPVHLDYGRSPIGSVDLWWRDRRGPRDQKRTIYLTPQTVT